jgi:hypothetical protein
MIKQIKMYAIAFQAQMNTPSQWQKNPPQT